jgi:hypothetical protein
LIDKMLVTYLFVPPLPLSQRCGLGRVGFGWVANKQARERMGPDGTGRLGVLVTTLRKRQPARGRKSARKNVGHISSTLRSVTAATSCFSRNGEEAYRLPSRRSSTESCLSARHRPSFRAPECSIPRDSFGRGSALIFNPSMAGCGRQGTFEPKFPRGRLRILGSCG